MGNGIWSSGRATIRGASGREFDLSSPEKQGVWDGAVFKEPLSHSRVFSTEEIWSNYAYFIRQVAPVAEETGVRIGIHPDDPPVPVLAGVPRCIFSTFDDIAGRWRSQTARMSESVSAAGHGLRAESRLRARTRKR